MASLQRRNRFRHACLLRVVPTALDFKFVPQKRQIVGIASTDDDDEDR